MHLNEFITKIPLEINTDLLNRIVGRKIELSNNLNKSSNDIIILSKNDKKNE